MQEIKNLSPQQEPQPESQSEPRLEPITQPPLPEKKKKTVLLAAAIFSALILGFFLSRIAPLSDQYSKKSISREGIESEDVISSEDLEKIGTLEVGKSYGDTDQSFKDSAQGILEKNGLDTEGTHKLLRDDREDQTIYIVSSVLDLDLFNGREVEIWGETFDSQKAGWFMDIGLVKVLK